MAKINKPMHGVEDQADGRMTQSENSLIQLPLSVVARRLAEEDAKILKAKPVSALDVYSQKVVKGIDWVIREQPRMTLPLGLAGLLSQTLRDEGNELIEETRALNNRFVGWWMEDVHLHLISDLELMDLRSRVLTWCQKAMQEVLYKRRRGAKNEPVVTYSRLYEEFIRKIDTRIAHGNDRMYQEVWSCAVDCMCYELFAGCFLEPGHIVCRHGSDAMHLSKWEGACLRDKHIASYIDLHADLYAVDIAFYSLDVVLRPLAAALAEDAGRNPDAALQADFHACLGDLLEAFPYLCASKRTSRYTFPVRGTTCMAAFRFLARGGFGVFMFFDSEDNMRAGLEIGVCRAALTIDFDGTIGALMHPWLTVGNILTSTDGLRTSHWLISQVRDQIVEDYLKINRYFLQPNLRDGVPGSGPGVSEGANDPVDCAEWARELREPVDAGPGSSIAAVVASVRLGPFLPQIRRSRFFRVLRLCGVEIVQGKGSEIKLLRGDAHPFRLGSHYGPNPTIPSFLAGRILKRLGVSRDEWTSAIRASGL